MHRTGVSADGSGPGSWGVQQLADFLASVAGSGGTDAVVASAAQGLADALEADVCAIVSEDGVDAVVAFHFTAVPGAELLAAAAGEVAELVVPGIGTVPTTTIEAGHGASRRVLVGRRAAPLDTSERDLVRAMAQVLELTLQLRGTAERERQLREAVERQAEELREVNEQLVEAVQVKRDLVSMASHELRTPLVAMLGFSRLFKEGWEDFSDAERDQYLGIMDRHGRRMLRLVDDLLTVGRLEDGRLVTRRVAVSLSQAVVDALHDLGHRDLSLRTPDDDDEVLVDVDHLSQIVANLVDNARKYGAPPIELAVTTAPAWCRLDVVDAGGGVPEEFVPELFERFTQATTGLRREGTGVGLGLAIVAGLAERNDGTVEYDRADGRTRFSVRFPRTGAGDDRV